MKRQLRQAMFPDRDGVLNRAIVRNETPHPPVTPAELESLPDASKALRVLKVAGFLLIGATNQPNVARVTQGRGAVEVINAALLAALPLLEILAYSHDDREGCDCRKPLPGLVVQAAARHPIDLSSSCMIGDRWKDVETGHRACCRTVSIDYRYGQMGLGRRPPHYTAYSLSEAAGWILRESNEVGGII